jgi:hypothetical protein
LAEQFDVVCLGGAVGEAIAVGLQGSGLTLAVVKRELAGGECPYRGLRYHATVERRQLNQRSPSRRANPSSRSRAISLLGALPKKRPYSLLNCDGLR